MNSTCPQAVLQYSSLAQIALQMKVTKYSLWRHYKSSSRSRISVPFILFRYLCESLSLCFSVFRFPSFSILFAIARNAAMNFWTDVVNVFNGWTAMEFVQSEWRKYLCCVSNRLCNRTALLTKQPLRSVRVFNEYFVQLNGLKRILFSAWMTVKGVQIVYRKERVGIGY